ncbi:hypothetical protein [Paracoccus sp. PAR01]|uniref:hypothetical protein n=1 Tax=Paracoccus sp. PAR01 TaxID=2769282 RepID=UPI00177EF735|nr:hypothetical protein [Paracoccus sp. PAR01]MBD9525206.1 hypothetical protein [Paracoccus sp. PAR01]
MLERYIEAGHQAEAFWGLTLRLYQIHMQGAAVRIQRDHDHAKAMAWLTAGLSRAAKMPKLDRLLQRDGEIIDTGFRLSTIKAQLPVITMAEWAARQGAMG